MKIIHNTHLVEVNQTVICLYAKLRVMRVEVGGIHLYRSSVRCGMWIVDLPSLSITREVDVVCPGGMRDRSLS